jgi:hypothetical protein
MTKSTAKLSQCGGCGQMIVRKKLKDHVCDPTSITRKSKNKYADAPRTKTVGSFGSVLADALNRKS